MTERSRVPASDVQVSTPKGPGDRARRRQGAGAVLLPAVATGQAHSPPDAPRDLVGGQPRRPGPQAPPPGPVPVAVGPALPHRHQDLVGPTATPQGRPAAPERSVADGQGGGDLAEPRGGQLPAARYRSTTSALMRPRGETSIPCPFAQARTAAGSKPEKAGFAGRAPRRPPLAETFRAART